MDEVIIYPNDDGSISIVHPAPDCWLSITQIALKDVLPGRPFLIVPADSIPQDHLFFSAFEADFSNPHGYGADYGTGSNVDVIGWNPDKTPILRAST